MVDDKNGFTLIYQMVFFFALFKDQVQLGIYVGFVCFHFDHPVFFTVQNCCLFSMLCLGGMLELNSFDCYFGKFLLFYRGGGNEGFSSFLQQGFSSLKPRCVWWNMLRCAKQQRDFQKNSIQNLFVNFHFSIFFHRHNRDPQKFPM